MMACSDLIRYSTEAPNSQSLIMQSFIYFLNVFSCSAGSSKYQSRLAPSTVSTEATSYSILTANKCALTTDGVVNLSSQTRCPADSVDSSAWKSSIRRFVITEKAPTRAFSWLKAATTAFTFKTLLRHYAKQALTPRSLNMKLGPRRNYHKGRAAIRHYAKQIARPLWPLRRGPNFTLRDRGVNARLA